MPEQKTDPPAAWEYHLHGFRSAGHESTMMICCTTCGCLVSIYWWQQHRERCKP